VRVEAIAGILQPMQTLRSRSLVAVVGALVMCVCVDAASATVVYGYPLTDRCPAAGVAEEVDRWGMFACNCTSYVAWALQANGQRLDWFVPGAMDAHNWAHVAKLSLLPIGMLPRRGAVVVWPNLEPPFGHVAYVTGVDSDGGFDVAEYNFPPASGAGPFLFDRRKDVSRTGAIFIYVPHRG
jgi:surface antigen